MRLVLTTNFSPWSPYSGGGQHSTHNLALALHRRGHDVTVVYTRALGETFGPPVPQPYRVRWAPFVGLASRRQAPLRVLNAVTVASTLARIMARRDVDAVHGNGEEAALVPALQQRYRFTFVLTPRYPDYPSALLDRGRATRWQRARLLVRDGKYLVLGEAVRRADWVCPTSQSAAAMLERAFGSTGAHLRVIPNGIDPVFLEVAWQPEAAASGPVVFFGRLARSKGADTLIEALARLGPAAPRCLVIGRGDDEPTLRRLVHAHGLGDKVELVQWRSKAELARTLAHARMAVLPSREESFGNAIAESMAVGVPLVSTRAGSIPELVEPDRTGLLVAPGDAVALATAMQRLLEAPALARALGDAARAEVRSRKTWDAVAASFEECYRGAPS